MGACGGWAGREVRPSISSKRKQKPPAIQVKAAKEKQKDASRGKDGTCVDSWIICFWPRGREGRRRRSDRLDRGGRSAGEAGEVTKFALNGKRQKR